MPSTEQATVYASVTHYLKAVKAAGTKDASQVMKSMKSLPVEYFGNTGEIRDDGRVVFDLTLYRVKRPDQSKGSWDYYEKLATISRDQAFRPLAESECPMVRK